MNKKTYQAYIEEKKELVFEVSDKIWEYAELSLKEHKSCQLYCKVLKEEGFTVENPVAGIETAFAASFGSGSPVIGILGEYDALSGLSQKAGAAAITCWEQAPWRLPSASKNIFPKNLPVAAL